MSHLKIVLLSLTIVAVLSGCSTTSISSAQADKVPDSNQLLYKTARTNTVPVLIVRDSGANGSLCTTKILVNGKIAAFIKVGEKVTLHLPPGEIVIGAENYGGLCGGVFDAYEANLVLGRPKQFRLGFDVSGSIHLAPSAKR